jgi:hypothetical protein
MIAVVPTAPSTTKRHYRDLSAIPENAWLRFDRNVSRDLVHRKALPEVLVTDTVQVADDEFLLGTQLPRAHILWSDRQHSYHDPLITVEVTRQAALAIPQRYYDVKPDWHFISTLIDFRVVDLDAFADDETAPPEGILRARFSKKRERNGMLSGITLESELTINGALAGTVLGVMMFYSKTTYKRLRSYQRKSKELHAFRPRAVSGPIDPARVGRVFARNVTIGESPREGHADSEQRYLAIVDQKHPSFFDHPLDHVPGALLVEVYRQAAIATATGGGEATPAAAVLTRFRAELSDFAELDAPVECSATIVEEEDGGAHIALAMHQLDSQIGDAHVELDFV